jgi:hypothetical protein
VSLVIDVRRSHLILLCVVVLHMLYCTIHRREAEKLELVRHEQSDMARFAKEVCVLY